MKYVKKVHIINFQSHKDSVIDFGEGLNVILGRSDSGKTAIIRAIKWALYNEPRGDYFVRNGEKETSVEITFSDNTVIKRSRNGTRNIYEYKDLLGNINRFEGFGSEVPQEIIDESSIYKTTVGQNKEILYVQDQLEGPFLLSLSPGQKAQEIGRLIGVDILDDAISGIRKDTLKINAVLKEKDDERRRLLDELKNYEYLEEYEKKLDRLQVIEKSLSDKNERLENLNFLKGQIDLLENNIKKTKEYLNKFENLDILLNNLNTLSSINLKKDLLEDLNLKIKKADLEISKSKNFINSLSDLDYVYKNIGSLENSNYMLTVLMDLKNKLDILELRIKNGVNYISSFERLNEALDISKSLENKISKIKELQDILKNLENNKLEIDKFSVELEKSKSEIENILKEYENIYLKLDYCPFCYSKIDKDRRSDILTHLRGEI